MDVVLEVGFRLLIFISCHFEFIKPDGSQGLHFVIREDGDGIYLIADKMNSFRLSPFQAFFQAISAEHATAGI